MKVNYPKHNNDRLYVLGVVLLASLRSLVSLLSLVSFCHWGNYATASLRPFVLLKELRFKEDPVVSKACLAMLQELDLNKEPALATYLILACEGLPREEFEDFAALASDSKLPKILRRDIEMVVKNRHV